MGFSLKRIEYFPFRKLAIKKKLKPFVDQNFVNGFEPTKILADVFQE
jgi:hypothetical protein